FQAEDGIRDFHVTGVQTCALPILSSSTDGAHIAAQLGLPYAFASHFASTHLHNALRIYEQEFQASESLSSPYIMAGINVYVADRSEERRVGKECGYRWSVWQ